MRLYNLTLEEPTKNRRLAILLLLLVAGRVVMALVVGDIGDDPYITYRYADNLAGGDGLVFNHGERVQGFSSPLYTLLMSASSFVFGSQTTPVLSTLVSLLFDSISLLLLWRLLSPLADFGRFLACSLFALYPKVVLIGISGMEVSLVVTLMLLSLYLLESGRIRGMFVVFGLLLLCRIDSVVWIGVLLAWSVANKSPLSVRDFLVPTVLYGTWLLFSFLYYGSLIPHTIIAKSVSWHHMFPMFDPVRILLGYFPFHGLRGISSTWGILAVSLFLIPVLVELNRLARSREMLVIAPVFFVLYNLAFSFGRVLMFDWYYLPGYVAYFITLGTLTDWLIRKSRFYSYKTEVWLRAESLVTIALILLTLFGVHRWGQEIPERSFRGTRSSGNG